MNDGLSHDAHSAPQSDSGLNVRTLRRRWKPTKERLINDNRCEHLRIRVHRAFSWLARVEAIEAHHEQDAELLFRWVALNSLYGKWDADTGEARPDKRSLREFVAALTSLDVDERLGSTLQQQRRLVMSIIEDEYLSPVFWRSPSDSSAREARKLRHDAARWYNERRHRTLLEHALLRIYTMRCQLVHGAATFGSKINRSPVERCNLLLRELLPSILLVIIDHGESADWNGLCYPPLQA